MPLPEPIGEQREVVTLRHNGHTVVLGTAGSGKTTMAVHRAAFLSHPVGSHAGPTLLLSFNKSLLAYLNYLRPPELQDVDIRTYHRFATGYLRSREKMGQQSVCGSDGLRELLLGKAVARVRAETGNRAFLKRPLTFFLAEARWIGQMGIIDADEYAEVERVGRGDEGPLRPAQRELMFRVYEAYRSIRLDEGEYLYDWDDISVAVGAELASDEADRHYRHIVVDEGQDFSPSMLRSLAAAIPANGSLTIFGDVAQQVYGRRISWRQAGLEVGTPWRFRRNYRNSPEIARLGMAIAKMPYFAGEPDMVMPTEFAAQGPKPTLVTCNSPTRQVEVAVEQARAVAAASNVAILVRRHQEEKPFKEAFGGDAKRLHRDMTNWSPDPGISYGCVHNAKGFEFDTVILVGLDANRWPDPQAIAAEGEVDATASDGRLLYVGVTRARSNLILLHSGTPTALLPTNDELWVETKR